MEKKTVSEKHRYTIWSGEGTTGSRQDVIMTELGLKRRLTAERCNGDRWAYACNTDSAFSGSCSSCKEFGLNF